MIRYSLPLTIVLLVIVAGTSWGQGGRQQLFGPAASELAAQTGHSLQRRHVTVDSGQLTAEGELAGSGAAALYFQLFGGQRYVATGHIEETAGGGTIWQGHIEGQPDETVTFVTYDGVAAGTIRAGGRLYRLSYSGDGVHLLEEVTAAEPMPEHPPIPILEAPQPDGLERGQAPGADNGSVIDVLVVYTPASRARYGGTAGIEALINLAVAETNEAYQRSQINTRLSLVATEEVNYSESGSMVEDLSRLRNKGDGQLEAVHTWRDSYAVDTVTLIEEASDFCGIAFLMTTLSIGFEDHAFSVVDSDCATGYFSFGHELGHNMGSTHDHANGSNSLYPYSFGYWAQDYSFRTIMAYNCPGGCVRVQNFSNPNVLYNGQPTGIAYSSNPSLAANNARSINEASYTVANWRDSASRQPAAPSSLAAVAQSPTQINLTWQDNASGELGFELERRKTGQSWALIADLAANMTGYQDSELTADTTYEYRVRSYTSSANSDYSNVAYATTPREPELHLGEISGGGAIQSGTDPASFVWRAVVLVSVHDAYHDPVNGATVNGQWSAGASGSGSCLTDASGSCQIEKSGLAPGTGSVTFSVTEITNGGDPYLPDHNHDPEGNGVTITMFRPIAASFMPVLTRHFGPD
jgi:hypothetical protein